MTINLFYLPPSPPSRAVIVLAKVLGVHLNLKTIDVTQGEQLNVEYTAINPQHTIPTIIDNGFVLTESRAIMGYLVNKYAKNDSLYPRDPKGKGIVDQRLYFDNGTLFARIADCYIPVAFGMANVIDENNVEAVEQAFEILNKYLESSEYVAGDHLTIADITISITVGLAEGFGFDITRYENVCSWFSRCKDDLDKYGYEEINEPGQALGEWFRANLEAAD